MSDFQVIGNKLHIDQCATTFSTHIAAFEAGMRLRDPNWVPMGPLETYFRDDDAERFERFRQVHAIMAKPSTRPVTVRNCEDELPCR